MDMVARLCGRVVVMAAGRHLAEGRPDEVARDPAVVGAYLGAAGMTPALSTHALVAGYERDLPIVRGVDLAVAPGELLVLLGPNGAGKSTLVKAIAGLVPVHSGTRPPRRRRHHRRPRPREGPPRPRLRAADREHLRHPLDPREPPARRRHPAEAPPPRAHRRALRHLPRPRRPPRAAAPARSPAASARCSPSPARWSSSPRSSSSTSPPPASRPGSSLEVFDRLKAINAPGRHHRPRRAERHAPRSPSPTAPSSSSRAASPTRAPPPPSPTTRSSPSSTSAPAGRGSARA